jgi:hypothetical protein
MDVLNAYVYACGSSMTFYVRDGINVDSHWNVGRFQHGGA